jgi:hypothetical protein
MMTTMFAIFSAFGWNEPDMWHMKRKMGKRVRSTWSGLLRRSGRGCNRLIASNYYYIDQKV